MSLIYSPKSYNCILTIKTDCVNIFHNFLFNFLFFFLNNQIDKIILNLIILNIIRMFMNCNNYGNPDPVDNIKYKYVCTLYMKQLTLVIKWFRIKCFIIF